MHHCNQPSHRLDSWLSPPPVSSLQSRASKTPRCQDQAQHSVTVAGHTLRKSLQLAFVSDNLQNSRIGYIGRGIACCYSKADMAANFVHWRLWWENYGTAEIGGRLVLVWWPFGCGQPIVMNGHFGLDWRSKSCSHSVQAFALIRLCFVTKVKCD